MPFGRSDADHVFENVYKPFLASKSINAVIAELTYERPNVYFEIGYALGNGFENKLILCCREDHFPESPNYKKEYKIHFDLANYNIIFWDMNKLDEFRENLNSKVSKRLEIMEKSKKQLGTKNSENNNGRTEVKKSVESVFKKVQDQAKKDMEK